MLQRSADADREGRSDQAFQHLLTTPHLVHKRQDGKPMLLDAPSPSLSASHQNYLTCAVTGVRAVGCDIEAIVPRATRTWQDLLGPERVQLATFLAAQTGEDMDTIGTRLWAASECLKKAGALVNVSLRFGARKDDGWLLLKAGLLLISTYVARVHSEKNPLVFAICSAVENNQEMERAVRRSLLAEKEKHGAGL